MIAEIIGVYSVPVVIVGASVAILLSKNNLFDEFTKGCRDGFVTSVKILPTLIILICAVQMFSASGALDVMCDLLGNVTEKIGIPGEIIPVIVTRPISGSAATAMINNLFAEHGADSFPARCAAVIMGSSDTIIYTLAMYFGAVGVTKTKYALACSFILFGFCVCVSVVVVKLYFGV